MSGRRVAVTGLGATTPLGGDAESTWSALLAGKSGVRLLEEEWAQELPVRIAAPAAVDPGDVLERAAARRLDRATRLAAVAAQEAWADAGAPDVDPVRLGVVVSSALGGVTSLLGAYDTLRAKGPRRVSPVTVPMLMLNGAAAHLAMTYGARAGAHAPASACASGAEAIGQAARMIRAGEADVVIAGGCEAAVHPLFLAAFASMTALSEREDDPASASRPWDRDRDGFVLGEGAGIVLLESAEHAERRGARVHAYLDGVGTTADAHHIAQPEPDGRDVARAIELALADAGLTPDDVVHVNAHATSTPHGDLAEAAALRRALGARAAHVPVSGTKSATGHLLGGAGAVEAVFTVLALRDRLAPPTRSLEHLDEEIEGVLDIVREEPRPLPPGPAAALDDSFGFGGHNVVLAFRASI
ncbi:beta-ketoacyl-[acyl-carrier-protein] synthase family protein [Streptomyces cellulosae]|uniref:3-oxoacyl-[acyl-carrier-protein] synthase 2 n=1 Tax=Streptomyces cellulosae TaxID=1968 RepID=A0ABW7YET2_STRCE